jgi:ADP-ribose pyrophosphatase
MARGAAGLYNRPIPMSQAVPDTEVLLQTRKFQVVRRMIGRPDGRPCAHEYIAHPGAVVILPLVDETRCLLLRHYRRTVGKELWELPAGTLDIPGETPTEAALRELEEETGRRAESLEYLCEFYPSPGVLTELIRAYVARGLAPSQQRLEPEERIRVEVVGLAEALAMCRDGRIVDAKTLITLLRWDLQWEGGR